ncbi:MAG TPA: hypothetical protein VE944_19380 [Nostoc sp.]|uniref:hypothetical protein n=1 Tax=Nostoc sp. TaxID=1180 RepID=UPI002D6AF3C8|nr:hypothetical protein [Nostoc sp.]HYX16485.1 hypothetical protein [Nostoc sp.]
MALDTFTIKGKIVFTITPDTGTTITPVFDYTPFQKAGYRVINEYLEINNLKAVAWIYSVAKVPFPVFELEDTESKQLLTAINLEWKSERIQMDVLITTNEGTNWNRIAAYSLLNSDPYPYREYVLGDHTLGDNAMIGIQMRNVGFGLLQNGNLGSDRVTVYADLVRVVTIEKISDSGIKIANNITTTPSTIMNTNINRTTATLFNSSDKNVFIDVVNTVSTTSHIIKLEPGDYYESPAPIYTGNYWAVVESGSTAIDVREFV